MPEFTPKLQLRKPEVSDVVNVELDVNGPAFIVDRELPVRTIIDDLTSVTPTYQGQTVYETKKRRTSVRVDGTWVAYDSPMAQRGRVKHVRDAAPNIAIPNALTLINSVTYDHVANRNHMIETVWSAYPDGGGGPFNLRVLVTITTGAAPTTGGQVVFDKTIRSPALNVDREIRTLGTVWFNTDVQKSVGIYASTDGAAKTWHTHGSFPLHLLIRDIGAEINYAP